MLAALIALVVVLGGFVLWRMNRAGAPAPTRPGGTAPPAAALAPARSTAPAPARPVEPPPSAATTARPLLPDDGRLLRLESLDAAAREALLAELRNIPRPPRALHQMLSPEFLARASSSELSDLVMTEPVVAARVMAAVNSPLYGLRRAVTSVGQAITFMGLGSVRSLCLQYLLSETIPTRHPGLRREFDTLWKASAIASELCVQLTKQLRTADAPRMATQLVLSFLGRIAAAALLRQRQAERAFAALPAGAGMAQRALYEQDHLGLAAGELGSLLMADWGLPGAMVTETRGIGRVVCVPAPAADPAHAEQLAICALCASLAERIARGELTDLAGYTPEQDDCDDTRSLRQHLQPATLAQVGEALRAPEMARALA